VAKKRAAKKKKPEVVGFVGVGLDNQDGHQRITQSEHFFLVGGSEETHERMQDTAIRFNKVLKDRGKTLTETEPREALDILFKAIDP